MSDSQITNAFEGLAAKAEAMMDAQEPNPAIAAPTTPTAPIVTQSEQSVTPQAAPDSAPQTQTAEPTVVDLPADALVRVKVNGKEEVVKMSDYKEMVSGTADYTRRTQTLAEQRRQLEDHFAQREAELQQAARWIQAQAQQQDPVQRLAQALQAQQPPKPQQNPNEIVTVGEVQKLLAEFAAQQQGQLGVVKQEITESQRAALIEAQEKQFIAQESARFGKAMEGLMETDDGKLLADVNPEADKLIRWETAKMRPENTEQAVEFAQKVAKGWADKVREKFVTQQKTVAVEAARVKMEPPGSGSAPALQTSTKPQSYLGKDGGVDMQLLRQRAMEMVEKY